MSAIFFYQIALAGLGLILLIRGANMVVDSSVSLSKKWQIPEWLTGMTVVALGTSFPELATNIYSSIIGHDDFIVGNILGSNLFNLLGVLGISGLMYKVTISRKSLQTDWLFSLLMAVLLLFFSFGFILIPEIPGSLVRWEGVVLLILFFAYFIYTFLKAQKGQLQHPQNEEKPEMKVSFWTTLSLIGGLIGLGLGSKLAVDGITQLSGLVSIPQDMSAIILLAGGTSLPELSACLAAFKKDKSDLAVGSILGSNIINIGFILGLSILIQPVSVINSYSTDMIFLIAGTAFPIAVLLFIVKFSKRDSVSIPIPLATMMLAFYLTFLATYLSVFYN